MQDNIRVYQKAKYFFYKLVSLYYVSFGLAGKKIFLNTHAKPMKNTLRLTQN